MPDPVRVEVGREAVDPSGQIGFRDPAMTALAKHAAPGREPARTMSTVTDTAAFGGTRVHSSWSAPTSSASTTGGSISVTTVGPRINHPQGEPSTPRDRGHRPNLLVGSHRGGRPSQPRRRRR